MKQGLVLDKVVLLGRTLDEYRRYFALDLPALRGSKILDVASGVSSFCAEASVLGLDVTAFDLIYDWPIEKIASRCGPDLDHVLGAIVGLKTYKWDFYKNPASLRVLREKAYKTFLADFGMGFTGGTVGYCLNSVYSRNSSMNVAKPGASRRTDGGQCSWA